MKKNSSSSWELALKILSKSSQTEGCLKEKLIERGIPEKEAQEVLNKAKYYGFLNDKTYALNVIEKASKKGKDRNWIAAKLLSQRIPRELVKELLPYVELPSSDYA